jgi:hypothetical protein
MATASFDDTTLMAEYARMWQEKEAMNIFNNSYQHQTYTMGIDIAERDIPKVNTLQSTIDEEVARIRAL